ncbi:MAG: polysaccharide deacetylase family protein, partial [Gemmatimonadota bacterium]
LERLLPIVADELDRLTLRCTFFIVGRDAANVRHHDVLADLTRRGHHVGNHSYEHEPWLHRYSAAQLAAEVARAEESIERAANARPIGFRGPGFSWTTSLLHVLHERGYEYDASTFPTFIGPLARTYYFWTARLSRAEREERAELFGGWRDVMRPIDPYRWRLTGERTLLEIPVTTIPLVRTPFHLSYLLYIAGRSEAAALGYLRMALALCRLTRVEPSILLHPLDFLGGDEEPRLAFFPAMQMSGARKRDVARRLLSEITQTFDVQSLDTYARALVARNLPTRLPNENREPSGAGLRPKNQSLLEHEMGDVRMRS